MLLGLATQGDNPQAGGWLGQFRTAKIQNQLVPVFNAQLTGGGSREGTGYGAALRELFELYYLWEISTGERIADLTPHTKASLPQLIHNLVPTLGFFANIGDQARASDASVYDYHIAYGKVLLQLYPADRMSAIGRTVISQMVPMSYGAPGTPGMSMRPENYFSDFLFHPGNVAAAQPVADLATAYHAPGTGVFAARGGWAPTAAYGNFLCGPNDESHAHRDRGSFSIFRGSWLAFDANAQSNSGLVQWGHAHNLVRFARSNGTDIEQSRDDPGCVMRAVADTPLYAYASANVLPAFPANSGVVRSERRFLFIKPGVFVVFDPAQTSGTGMRRIWTLNLPAAPAINGGQISYVQGANRLDAYKVAPASATVQVFRWSTETPVDYSEDFAAANATAYRVDVTHAAGDTTEFLHVLSTNGAVTGTPASSDTAGQVGTQFTLADGRTVTVRFNIAGDGGNITIRQGTTTLLDEALPTTVQTLPLFAN